MDDELKPLSPAIETLLRHRHETPDTSPHYQPSRVGSRGPYAPSPMHKHAGPNAGSPLYRDPDEYRVRGRNRQGEWTTVDVTATSELMAMKAAVEAHPGFRADSARTIPPSEGIS